MSKYVKISSLGRTLISANEIEDGSYGLVENVKALWQKELDKVLPDKPDLIVLPECCDIVYGLTDEKRIEYNKVKGYEIRNFFMNVAKENNCYIAYSASRLLPDGTKRNSTQMIDRNGNIAGIYNKNHLTINDSENNGTLYGADANVIQCDFGKVACAICFDLNFDELRLKYIPQKPDLIVFSSLYHGGLMQNYWAYSCRSYFVGCVSDDENTIISPVGEIIAKSTNYYDYVTHTINLDYIICHLDYNRPKLQNLKMKYGRKVKIFDPGHLGSVLITSETEEYTAMDFAKEFELELLDEYFERCREHRSIPGKVEKTEK
ncbi:MAG TPA: carbon-nitrogen hydrolase family protein [Clostridiales bacterium]|nr:carbon-nitrogen hydrolase family protein [Clostridiales bacterium]